MKEITVALVGRPNVGKSSLFNRICGRRISISHEEEGVTRDRIYGKADLFGQPVRCIDTGGIDTHSDLPFQEEIRMQALMGVEEADAIIMVVDAVAGLTSLDEEVAKILLKSEKPVILAINKVDNRDEETFLYSFSQLGIKDMIGVSATQNYQIAELLEKAARKISIEDLQEIEEVKGIKIAIVGRANVGKSTLLNCFFQKERSIVSSIPGTTRDSIDARLSFANENFIFVDTAGIRRKKSEKNVIEKFASVRTWNAIDQADICLLVIDSVDGMTTEEKKIAQKIEKEGKGCILVFNKWDLVKGFRMEHCLQSVRKHVSFLQHCPAEFISAKTGRNVQNLFSHIKNVYKQLSFRIPTGELNRFLEKCMQRVHPPLITGKRLRIYYLTQVGEYPPSFVFFINYPDLLVPSYRKYLINEFRKRFSFTGVPLHFKMKKKSVRDPSQ